MATLTNQNQWYDVATQGPFTSTISGISINWTNVIQARWTSRSGTTYYVQYRCVLRRNSGSLTSNTSSYNGYSIGGTGVSTVSDFGTTINFPDAGDNVIATTSGSINGTSGTVIGGVTLGYYGETWGDTDFSGSITLPAPYVAPTTPTISSSALTSNSVTITYGTTSFGTPSTGTVTLYGGTTANPTTVLDTYNATGDHTFTHTGLTPSTTYYYRARANNGQLDSNYSTEISVTTYPPYGFYGSVNGQTKRVTKMYGPVNKQVIDSVSGTIRAGGIGNVSAFDGSVFLTAASSLTSIALDYLSVARDSTGDWTLYVYFSDGTTQQRLVNHGSSSQITNYGITLSGNTTGTDYIDLTTTYTTTSVSKEIIKMYGPVQVAEQYSITPDGLVVTAIDGELLCATAKEQYPSTYMNAVTFEFGLDSLYYARGLDSNNNQVFYRSGSASALTSAGVTFSPSATSGVSTTLPATYVPAASVAKRIF